MRRGLPRTRLLRVLLLLLLALVSGGDARGGSGSSDGIFQQWFERQFADNATHLVGFTSATLQAFLLNDTGGSKLEPPCNGMPALLTRSSARATANGNCPALFTSWGLSCTCLADFAGQRSAWTFNVMKKAPGRLNSTKTAGATDVLEIDVIESLVIPSDLERLVIRGASQEALPIKFVTDNALKEETALPLAKGNGTALKLRTVELYNIDLSDVIDKSSNFLPSSVTNITIQNCNYKSFSLEFIRALSNVEYLDWSNNKLTDVFVGKSDSKECALCSVVVMNMTNNNISEIPPNVFNVKTLRKLYIRGNPIQGTISDGVFKGIADLTEFTADPPTLSSGCATGELRVAHNLTWCVLSDSPNAALGPTSSQDQSSTSYILYSVVGCSMIVVLLAAYVIRQRWFKARRSSNKNDDTSAFDNTLEFDESFNTVNNVLSSDPLIVTNRIPYTDVRVGKCISQGGFGLVFVGTYLGRKVAIKKIRPDLSDNLGQIEQFVKEIALMAMLVHPRIVEFVGVAWDSLRHLSAVTEFMERGDLRDVLQGFKSRGCRLTWASHKTHISVHIAEALTYLHSLRPKKVIHRDLKSKNVLLNADLEAKLSDFGISRERRFEETHMTAGIGTSFWIAPEVLLGKDYDERADIFSFGVVLCEIDTDDYPYWNDKNPQHGGKLQQAEILRQVADGSLRPTFSDDCPKAILDLADSCLQADPADRPTAPEIVYELQRIQQEQLW